MTEFGGLGGVAGGRPRDNEDLFECAVEACMGDKLREDESWGRALWGSLANVDWVHENGDTASYSFRAAGDLIAAIVGKGDYMDWYCSAPYYGECYPHIREAMATQGWRPVDC